MVSGQNISIYHTTGRGYDSTPNYCPYIWPNKQEVGEEQTEHVGDGREEEMRG